MGKKRTQTEFVYRPDPRRVHLLVDEQVKLPRQVEHAAAAANARATGQPVPPKPKRKASQGFPYSDTEVDEALRRLENGQLQLGDPEFAVIRELANEGARHMKSRRLGARKTRVNSDTIARRLEAELQAYRELSPKRQANPTGAMTLRALREAVIKKLGVHVSEDTIKKDIQQLGLIFRLVREGVVPPPGAKPVMRTLSKETRGEMIAGKRTLARHRSGR